MAEKQTAAEQILDAIRRVEKGLVALQGLMDQRLDSHDASLATIQDTVLRLALNAQPVAPTVDNPPAIILNETLARIAEKIRAFEASGRTWDGHIQAMTTQAAVYAALGSLANPPVTYSALAGVLFTPREEYQKRSFGDLSKLLSLRGGDTADNRLWVAQWVAQLHNPLGVPRYWALAEQAATVRDMVTKRETRKALGW